MNSYFRFLLRNKLYTIIIIIGFSISLSFAILLGSITYKITSIDKFHKSIDNLYILGEQENNKKDISFYYSAPLANDIFKERYSKEIQLRKILLLFTLIILFITIMGVYAMAAYFMKQRIKECAIRKVYGSTSLQLQKMLISRFLILVFIGSVIAIPITWYFASEWLKTFIYKITIMPWPFILAFLITLMLSSIAIYGHAFITSRRNPAVELKK